MSNETISTRRFIIDEQARPEDRFVPALLPWLVAAASILIYGLTLNHWVSFGNLFEVSKTSGWLWEPSLSAPLNWLITYPFRLLPIKLIPIALNAFAAVCAAFTLGLLARSVALLPHDRTHEQRQRAKAPSWLLTIRTSWLPPLFAVIACGLQLTFWEHATAANGLAPPYGNGFAMLNTLLFAYIIRCLLEFRIDQNESWLYRSALIYGLAATSSWAMVAFLPVFLTALIWIKGLAFFDSRFLVRMLMWGLAGLSLYLLLPIINSLANIAPVSFWTGLKLNLIQQKAMLGLYFHSFFQDKQKLLLISLTTFMPILLIAIRWASYFGDTSKLGVALTTFAFHIVHGVLLLLCVWVTLDPPFSPRFTLLKVFGLPSLNLYYLGALSIGYFIGYFLLLLEQPNQEKRKPDSFIQFCRFALAGCVWVLAGLVTLLLVYKNLPEVQATNGQHIRRFATLLADGLPPEGSIILSDDPRRMALARAAAAQIGKKYIFLDSHSLPYPQYHRFLKRTYPSIWPVDPGKDDVDPYGSFPLMDLFSQLAATTKICYLHPSFGYYFEIFHPEPHGLAYYLNFNPTNTLITPPLSKGLLMENQSFWRKAQNEAVDPLLRVVAPGRQEVSRNLLGNLLHWANIRPEPNENVGVLIRYFSRALDYWGVELQRNGELAEAAKQFELAKRLYPDNVVASINLECNHNLQAGRPTTTAYPKSIQDEFGKYRDWEQVMNENGPFDDPQLCFEEGKLFIRTRLFRQAADQFARVMTLNPLDVPSRLLYARLNLMAKLPDFALDALNQIRAEPLMQSSARTNQAELLTLEASAHLAKDDLAGAESAVEKTLQQNPADQTLLLRAAQTYMEYNRYSNALSLIQRQLKINPEGPGILLNLGYVQLKLEDYPGAIGTFSHVLNLETNLNGEIHIKALMNRAISNLKAKQYADASRDYEALQKAIPTAYQIYYGLQEIAYQEKNTNAAIRNCQLYLSNAPPNLAEFKVVSARLKELKPGFP